MNFGTPYSRILGKFFLRVHPKWAFVLFLRHAACLFTTLVPRTLYSTAEFEFSRWLVEIFIPSLLLAEKRILARRFWLDHFEPQMTGELSSCHVTLTPDDLWWHFPSTIILTIFTIWPWITMSSQRVFFIKIFCFSRLNRFLFRASIRVYPVKMTCPS